MVEDSKFGNVSGANSVRVPCPYVTMSPYQCFKGKGDTNGFSGLKNFYLPTEHSSSIGRDKPSQVLSKKYLRASKPFMRPIHEAEYGNFGLPHIWKQNIRKAK